MQLVVKLQASWSILFGQKFVNEVTMAIAEAMLIIVIPTSAPVGIDVVSCFVGVTTGSTTGVGSTGLTTVSMGSSGSSGSTGTITGCTGSVFSGGMIGASPQKWA